MSLTDRKVEALSIKDKRYIVTDGKGLVIRVYPSGKKTWYFRTPVMGRLIDKRLGDYPELSIHQARQRIRDLRKEIGLEPPKGYILKDAFKLWCKLKKNSIVSYEDEKRRLEKYIIKPLGNKQLDEITAPIVIQVVQQIEQEGKQATLKRVLMRLREILDLAVCAGFIQGNPLAKVSRVFAAPKVVPMPSIDWRELPYAMTVMASAPKNLRILFLFSLCSLLRPGENAKIKKSWIVDDGIYIPAEEMKKRKPFRVPISSFMKQLLERMDDITTDPNSPYIFTGKSKGKHINAQALAKYLHSSPLSGKLVAHGLRSIGRSWLADEEVPFDIAEMCLAHDVGTMASRAYQRSDFFESRRIIMEKWSEFIKRCADSAGLTY